jgi:hypothetical protein
VGEDPQRPEGVRIRPRRLAGALDVPHREHVVDLAEGDVDVGQRVRDELGLRLRLDEDEERVDLAEVAVLRLVVA